jgi:hypothetical protein
MKIRITNIMDIKESNIDEVKLNFAEKIIKEVEPLINNEYQKLKSEYNELEPLIRDKHREAKIESKLSIKINETLKKKLKIQKLFGIIKELSNYNINTDIVRELKLLFKVVDDLSEKRIDLNIANLTTTLNEKKISQ